MSLQKIVQAFLGSGYKIQTSKPGLSVQGVTQPSGSMVVENRTAVITTENNHYPAGACTIPVLVMDQGRTSKFLIKRGYKSMKVAFLQ